MNKAFREVVKQTQAKAQDVTHKQKVTRLYKASLKLAFSWAADRDIFLDEAETLRERFDNLSHLPSEGAIAQAALNDGYEVSRVSIFVCVFIVWLLGRSLCSS